MFSDRNIFKSKQGELVIPKNFNRLSSEKKISTMEFLFLDKLKASLQAKEIKIDNKLYLIDEAYEISQKIKDNEKKGEIETKINTVIKTAVNEVVKTIVNSFKKYDDLFGGIKEMNSHFKQLAKVANGFLLIQKIEWTKIFLENIQKCFDDPEEKVKAFNAREIIVDENNKIKNNIVSAQELEEMLFLIDIGEKNFKNPFLPRTRGTLKAFGFKDEIQEMKQSDCMNYDAIYFYSVPVELSLGYTALSLKEASLKEEIKKDKEEIFQELEIISGKKFLAHHRGFFVDDKIIWRQNFIAAFQECLDNEAKLLAAFKASNLLRFKREDYCHFSLKQLKKALTKIDVENLSFDKLKVGNPTSIDVKEYSIDLRFGENLSAAGFTPEEINKLKIIDILKYEAALWYAEELVYKGSVFSFYNKVLMEDPLQTAVYAEDREKFGSILFRNGGNEIRRRMNISNSLSDNVGLSDSESDSEQDNEVSSDFIKSLSGKKNTLGESSSEGSSGLYNSEEKTSGSDSSLPSPEIIQPNVLDNRQLSSDVHDDEVSENEKGKEKIDEYSGGDSTESENKEKSIQSLNNESSKHQENQNSQSNIGFQNNSQFNETKDLGVREDLTHHNSNSFQGDGDHPDRSDNDESTSESETAEQSAQPKKKSFSKAEIAVAIVLGLAVTTVIVGAIVVASVFTFGAAGAIFAAAGAGALGVVGVSGGTAAAVATGVGLCTAGALIVGGITAVVTKLSGLTSRIGRKLGIVAEAQQPRRESTAAAPDVRGGTSAKINKKTSLAQSNNVQKEGGKKKKKVKQGENSSHENKIENVGTGEGRKEKITSGNVGFYPQRRHKEKKKKRLLQTIKDLQKIK